MTNQASDLSLCDRWRQAAWDEIDARADRRIPFGDGIASAAADAAARVVLEHLCKRLAARASEIDTFVYGTMSQWEEANANGRRRGIADATDEVRALLAELSDLEQKSSSSSTPTN